MNDETLAKLLDPVKEIAIRAGQAILAVAEEGTDVQEKADGSPLTRADLASHRTIDAGLRELEPKLPVLSEEGDLASAESFTTFWCVDPLDGTKEFVKGLTEYTVNIAIVEDAKPIFGVIYVPAQDLLYFAARGQGAWRTAGGKTERIAASDREAPKSAVASRSHLSEETQEFLKRLGVTETVQHGSSIKICAVAEGKADIYPRHGPTCLWDTAAGAAIAIEAGCEVIDLEGAPLSYDPAAGIKRPGFIVHPAGMDLPL